LAILAESNRCDPIFSVVAVRSEEEASSVSVH
jgi:hypothetical protein